MNRHVEIPTADGSVTLGNNNPPGQIELARGVYRLLSDFLKEHPVIATPEDAKEAGRWRESTSTTLKELDDERRKQVDPLNATVKDINGRYKPVRDAFTNDAERGLLDELNRRLTVYARAEEKARQAEAECLRQEAEAAELLAREAERQEADAIARVDVGELDVDVGDAIATADETFGDFAAAQRAAAVAAKQVPVRIASTLGGRAMSMRTTETFTVDDPCAAIAALGVTDRIRDAIVSAAKDWRRLHNGQLPPGVSSTKERSL